MLKRKTIEKKTLALTNWDTFFSPKLRVSQMKHVNRRQTTQSCKLNKLKFPKIFHKFPCFFSLLKFNNIGHLHSVLQAQKVFWPKIKIWWSYKVFGFLKIQMCVLILIIKTIVFLKWALFFNRKTPETRC